MAVAYVSIAVLFYLILKKYNESLAMGYFGLRIIGAGFFFVGIGSLLLLLWLSQSFVSAGQVNTSYFQETGELLRRGRDILNHIAMILPWSLGGLILYHCLLKMRLVPRWMSIWGIVGSALTLLATLLLMLDFIKIVTPVYFVLNTPTALFELSLALLLIFRGFNHIDVNSNEK
jgi:hypothetical protein